MSLKSGVSWISGVSGEVGTLGSSGSLLSLTESVVHCNYILHITLILASFFASNNIVITKFSKFKLLILFFFLLLGQGCSTFCSAFLHWMFWFYCSFTV